MWATGSNYYKNIRRNRAECGTSVAFLQPNTMGTFNNCKKKKKKNIMAYEVHPLSTCQCLGLNEPNRQLLNGSLAGDKLPAGRMDRFFKHRLTSFFFSSFSSSVLSSSCAFHTLPIQCPQHSSMSPLLPTCRLYYHLPSASSPSSHLALSQIPPKHPSFLHPSLSVPLL